MLLSNTANDNPKTCCCVCSLFVIWGETMPKTTYEWSTYKWCNGSENTMTKYCTSSSYGSVDNKTALELADDAARANWGGTWRMPTDEEWSELETKCIWAWTTQNSVQGFLVTGPNGSSIFLPTEENRTESMPVTYNGNYWSSSLSTSQANCALVYAILSGSFALLHRLGGGARSIGHRIRPVTK